MINLAKKDNSYLISLYGDILIELMKRGIKVDKGNAISKGLEKEIKKLKKTIASLRGWINSYRKKQKKIEKLRSAEGVTFESWYKDMYKKLGKDKLYSKDLAKLAWEYQSSVNKNKI